MSRRTRSGSKIAGAYALVGAVLLLALGVGETALLRVCSAAGKDAQGVVTAAAVVFGVAVLAAIAGVVGLALFHRRDVDRALAAVDAEAGRLGQGVLPEGSTAPVEGLGVEAFRALAADVRVASQAVVGGKLSARADASRHEGEYRELAEDMNAALDAIVRPLEAAARSLSGIARGQTPPKIDEAYPGDFRAIQEGVNGSVDAIGILVDEIGVVIRAGREGRLSQRANPERTQGVYKKVLRGVNDTLDALTGPLDVAARYVAEIANGEIPPKITQTYAGEFDALKENINRCIDAVHAMFADAGVLAAAAVHGNLSVRADVARHQGEYRRIMEGMNATLEAVVRPLEVAAHALDGIARGQTPAKITEVYAGDYKAIPENVNRCVDAIGVLVEEVGVVIQSGREGRLSQRANPDRTQGVYRKILRGVNDSLDAVVGPLELAASYVEDIAAGRIPSKITDAWAGEFNVLKDNLNRCIDTVHAMFADARMLALAAVEGNLAVRADAARHQGEYRKIVEGMNATLEAVVRPLEVAAHALDGIARGQTPAKITEAYAGDYKAIPENVNRCVDAIGILVDEVGAVMRAGREGRLSQRADADRTEGVYRKILRGMNESMDLLLAPTREALQVLERLAAHDLRARMTGVYQGDHAAIQEALNTAASSLNDALVRVSETADQVANASGEIASSSQSVASGASQQAACIEEASASIEAMSSTTSRSAESAQEANELAGRARGAAAEGTAVMDEMARTMARVRHAAESTAQIIKDINEISFQTNLLALNAAVEAARAGEAGRGFAVVAEEVRSLALRSKEAAGKTDELIRQSIRQAGEGEAMTRQANQKLSDISQGITRVSDIVAEIAATAKEQAVGFAQVTQAVGEMDKVTQLNAASSEESSSAAAELAHQSQELDAMLKTFRIQRDAPSSADGLPAGGPKSRTASARRSPDARPTPQALARAPARTSRPRP